MQNPLGIDAALPQLSWQLRSSRYGAKQHAYRIMVASRPEFLARNQPNVWDSGRILSSQSIHVIYGGPNLHARTRYYWKVRVWDETGNPGVDSSVNWWEMGLLSPSDWTAKWIANDSADDRADRNSGLTWIWTADEQALTNPKVIKHQFRLHLSLSSQPVEAKLFITAKDTLTAWINEKLVLGMEAPHPWGTFKTLDVTHALKPGENMLAAEVNVSNNSASGLPNSAGLAALLHIRTADGKVVRIVSSPSWKSALNQAGNWRAAEFDDSSWKQAVIAAAIGQEPLGTPWPPPAASYLRRTFFLNKPVHFARLYITALGSYQLHINGKRIDNQILAPGWTDYKARVAYQTYDVTKWIHPGENAVGALLGAGWYASGLTWSQKTYNFGPPPIRLLAQLMIEYEDGTHISVNTDGSWKAASSPVLSSDIYNGEEYDARLEQNEWDRASYVDAQWNSVAIEPAPGTKLEAQNFQPIRAELTLHAKAILNPSPGVYIFDMGQNMVGWALLRVKGARGTKVQLRFGEVLDTKGHFYAANMRLAKETDSYTLSGNGEEIFEPHFTYHGFRYVEVTGYPGVPNKDAIEGVVFHTDAPLTMQFRTNNDIVNQLWSNILWGQRGNFMSVPTDCPQRDERLGWMGDAQVFWKTASYNMDLAAFSHKFSEDMRFAQSPNGVYWDISPRIGAFVSGGNPGWADAGIIIPWTAYLQYGDASILRENWEAMNKWMAYLEEHNPTHIWHLTSTYGDWLAIGSETPNDLIATAYWAYDATLMSKIATLLHKDEEANKFHQLFEYIRDAFQHEFIKTDGVVGSGSQTSYVLALHMNLLPGLLRAKAAQYLAEDIKAHQWHLTTGFIGTPYLLIELSKNGYSDVAYKLLLNTTFPSWGYMISQGATTMWERWNGYQTLDNTGMNSFNHYAYGAVGEWLYRNVAGIDVDPGDPAFHHILLHPSFSSTLNEVQASYASSYGDIVSSWKDRGAVISWNVIIPPNSSAEIYFPVKGGDALLANGIPIRQNQHLKQHGREGSTLVYEAQSGAYRFTIQK